MDQIKSLRSYCSDLTSSKITDRKRGADNLDNLLEDKNVIKILNEDNASVRWNDVVSSVHLHLMKESEKLQEGQIKNIQRKKTAADLLTTVQKANSGALRLNGKNLVQYVLQCFDSEALLRHYFNTYILILKECILSQPRYLGRITKEDWIALLKFLQRRALKSDCQDTKVVECIKLILKHGPKHQLPVLYYRNEYDFIVKLCENLTRGSPSRYKAEVFQIVIDFCKYNAPDCWMSCCKLGEQLFGKLHGLYERRVADDCVKERLLEFCLLQIRLHHPHGATRDSSEAYAFNWTEWQRQLCSIYRTVEADLNYYTKTNTKPQYLYQRNSVFVSLAVAVCKQVFSKDLDVATSHSSNNTQSDTSILDVSQPSKRIKVDIGLGECFSWIKQSKSYVWIYVMTELLRTYPEIVNFEQSVELLKILISLYKEIKGTDMQRNIYNCFAVLVEIQNTRFGDRILEVDELWIFVADEILRSLTLHQNANSIHSLLHSLICNGKIKDPSIIYQTFISGALPLENYTITTLSLTVKHFGLSDMFNGELCKKKIIKWMMYYDQNTTKLFTGDELLFAKTMVSLCLKQWPENIECDDTSIRRTFEDVYALNSFQKLVWPNEHKVQINRSTSVSVHKDIHFELVNSLREFISHFVSVTYDLVYLQNSISAITIVGCILAEINTLDLHNNCYALMAELGIEELFKSINEVLYFYCCDNTHNKTKIFANVLKSFNNLLVKKFDGVVGKQYRTYITTNLLGCFFEMLLKLQSSSDEILEYMNEEIYDKEVVEDVRKTLVNILCNFSMYENNDSLTEIEEKIVVQLVQCNNEYETLVSGLDSVKYCKVGVLSQDVLSLIMESLETIWAHRSTEYKTTLKLLDINYSLSRHVGHCTSDQISQQFYSLLNEIYNARDRFGYKVSVALLDTFQLLFKEDLYINYKRYTRTCLSAYICNFLKSNYQLVRIKAVECLVTIFNKSFNDPSAQCIQKSICGIINLTSRDVFTMEEELNPERSIDEIVARTTSVFQTYAALITCNAMWRKNFLYSVLALTSDKQLTLDLLKRALELVVVKLQFEGLNTLITKYIDYLLGQWCSNERTLSSFPYEIAGYNSHVEFYRDYIRIIVPLYLSRNIEETDVYKELGLPLEEIINTCFVELVTSCFFKIATKSMNSKDFEAANKMYSQITEELTEERVQQLLFIKIDKILVDILTSIIDEKLYEQQYHMQYALETKEYPRSCLDEILNVIKIKVGIRQDLLRYCINMHSEKIQSIMLCLRQNVYNACSPQEKLKSLHQYFNFIDIIVPYIIEPACKMSDFCIHTTTFTLLHFIEIKCETTLFKVAVCCYLHSFLKIIVSNCDKKLENLFSIIVNKLILLLSDENLSVPSIKILKLLIVENVTYFKNIIPELDPLPPLNELADVNQIYKQLRTEKWGTSLIEEINHFIKGDISLNMCRLEALKQLKQTLAEKKDEVKEIFEITSKVRDFSEERKQSVIHQLICMLVELISSDNKHASIEAVRCLGEIGTSNLTTLILQFQNMDTDERSSPIQLLTSQVITLLYQCLTDQNIQIVNNASLALYEALSTKEGQYFIKNVENKVEVLYLQPFLPKHQKLQMALVNMDKKNKTQYMAINESTIWWYTDNDHNAWIVQLICTFLKCFPERCYLRSLMPVCRINVSLCEKLLPYLVHLYASTNETCVKTLSHNLNYFFDKVWDLSLPGDGGNGSKILSTQCMLDVILFSRIHVKNLEYNYQLQLDYLKLAQAAFYCSRFFDAIFYVELWCQLKAENIEAEKKFTGSPITLLDLVCGREISSTCLTAQNILRQSYHAIGEVDGLNGCGHAFLSDVSTRLDHYKQLGRWDQVALHYDTLLSRGEPIVKHDFAESLINCGYYALAMNYQEPNNPDYNILWRLSRYDCDTRHETNNPYEKQKYIALKALIEKDKNIFENAISEARLAVIESCKQINLQTTKGLYGVLTKLQMLQELEDVDSMGLFSAMQKWRDQDFIPKIDFQSCEPIKTQRIAILAGILASPEFSESIDTGACKRNLANLYLDLSASARGEKHFNIAKRAIASLSEMSDLIREYSYKKVLEEAQICWAMKDKVTARYLIHQLFTKNNDIKLNFAALKLYGQWMAESRTENPHTILNTYFLEPLKLMSDIQKEKEDLDNIFGTYYDIARFADLEYQRIRNYVKSTEFEQKNQNKIKSREAAEKIKSQAGARMDDDQKRAYHIYLKQSMIDEAEIDSTIQEKGVYLKLAIKYYMWNLQYSDVNDTRIFRVLSLWLENRNSEDLKKLLDNYVSKIPSYKFVSILPQLVPHLSNNLRDDFGNHVSSIIERCAKDHPHHTLPILLSLANSNMDEEYVRVNAATDSNEVRVEGAKHLLQKLKFDHFLNKIIVEMQSVSSALLELAYLDRDKCNTARGTSNYVIPASAKVMKIRNLSESYLPTVTVEVRKDCKYKDIIAIESFKKEFMGVGGINRPKAIKCLCSDGTTKQLLVKGKDDLRQDAVMEQVFTIMNDLFSNNKHTSKLLIRTYKVVPLSKRSGVIEWVENSQMIGEYLARLHNKYRPNDWAASRCQSKLKNASGKSSDEKEKIFKEICENFMPVMHKFFEEKYPHPTIWYERRRAYSHSLATTSISGYVLGLGDRHGGNILLDENTAEVIHIDFGIAFEQGKLLPTPETVPFRLTRDLEDGMGITGVSGVFKSSCERTMEVLRQNWETIIGILEVLLYDPLYAWTITPAEAYSLQNYDDSTPRRSLDFGSDAKINLNVTAERALLRLHQKLHGTEEGGSSSVEGQVEKLIQQARDPSNLSRLFYGWQAFL